MRMYFCCGLVWIVVWDDVITLISFFVGWILRVAILRYFVVTKNW